MDHHGSQAHLDSSPIDGFSQCHADILSGLRVLARLPEKVAAAERARRMTAEILALFDGPVMDHHAAEEAELFPAVLNSAAAGDEHVAVAAMIERLVFEHRNIEAVWKKLRPSLRSAAAGKPGELNAADVADMMRLYAAHAGFEEGKFLPLAQEILGRDGNHMAALGLALHMRHVPQVVGYI
jgi:hemerythrin-like domain-containing protein